MESSLKPARAASLAASISSQMVDSIWRQISETEFRRFQQLIYSEAGIWLAGAKSALLVGRLSRRLRHYGLKSFRQYYDLVVSSPEERIQMLNAISTNETHFFREPQHFELLRSSIFPRWKREAGTGRRSRKIRVWSAGCSTGQEPYSLAMVLLDQFPAAAGWQVEITATDISTRALETARNAIWPAEKAAEIPRPYLKDFMLRGFGEQAGKIKAGPELRSVMQFFRLNLNDPAYPLAGKFDLIFCRNVLIYFDLNSRERAQRRLAAYLAPDGYFFVGHAESLHAMGTSLTTVIPTVYTPKHDPHDDAG